MPGVNLPNRGPIDPHTGLPVQKLTQASYDAQRAQAASDQKLQRGEQSFYSLANNNRNVTAQYTDPRTGLAVQYDGTGAAGAAGSRGGAGRTDQPRVSLSELLSDYDRMAGPTPPRIVGQTAADRTAMNDAAYGRAKSKIGLQNRASMNSLRNMMSERNIEGSGIEGELGAGIIGHGQGDLADVITQQAGADVASANAVNDRNYAGDIQQRQQDMAQQQAKRAAIQALFSMRTAGGYEGRLY